MTSASTPLRLTLLCGSADLRDAVSPAEGCSSKQSAADVYSSEVTLLVWSARRTPIGGLTPHSDSWTTSHRV